MWAARPHLGSIFEKLLHRKTFSLPAALSLQPRLFYFDVVFHVKHSEIASRETTRNRFGKAGAHPQLVESYTNSLFFLEKTVFPVRQKGVLPLLLPTSMLQSPRCLVWICNLDSRHLTLFELDGFKNAIAAGKPSLKNKFASQMWATRPHLGSIFVKLLHRKTFRLPAACIL